MRSIRLLGGLIIVLFFINSCSKKSSTPAPNNPTGPTVPGCATNISPAPNSFYTGTNPNTTFTWNAVSGATTYDLYLGSTPATATVWASNIGGTSYTMPTLITQSSQL